ncbi:auxin-responsive protein IAA1-like isoform X2 [Diospyros lotus]|uniref:auxin-responsive protein IAA1-like isoform X2 n=1 Tax=Diospyros lotus TaxID=55363 RepID=UPI00224DCEC5|nr:auxin-responsive protein IAA1-like isoform X2 [Diospyros lotus]
MYAIEKADAAFLLFTKREKERKKKKKKKKVERSIAPEMDNGSPGSEASGLTFMETELTLGLPGVSHCRKSGKKRGFSETVELSLGSSASVLESRDSNCKDDGSGNEIDATSRAPQTKAQVIGWPPVRSFRKTAMKTSKYVKVAVDGAPYLRKLDLETYNSYQQLMSAVNDVFGVFTICNERKLLDSVNGSEYVATYEDKEGDWMLVGDVPWKLMKTLEAIGSGGRMSPNPKWQLLKNA